MRPTNTEIIVGESAVLPCQIASDPALDVSFSWAFNGQLIDFQRDGNHFERVGGVSHQRRYTRLLPVRWMCVLLPRRGLLPHQPRNACQHFIHSEMDLWSMEGATSER